MVHTRHPRFALLALLIVIAITRAVQGAGTAAWQDRIERHLYGLRDFAAAIFFFTFGLEIDIASVGDIWAWVLVGTVVAIGGKLVAGYLAGRAGVRSRFTRRQSFTAGASLIARGEFSLIVAQLAAAGVALDPTFRQRITSFTGVMVLVTAVVGVILMRESRTLGRAIFGSRKEGTA